MQTNFTAGEWSPRLHGRSDLAKYWNALEILENFIILPQGGVTRRPGWHFVKETRREDSQQNPLPSRKVRLIPFIFSTEQAYVIEAGDQYFRFFMNHGQIQAIPTEVKLLLHADGPNGSTTITDSSAGGHVMTAGGGAKLSTAASKFGSASLYLDPASSSYVSAADHADFDLSGAGIWSFDMWIQPFNNSGAEQTIFYQQTGANDYASLILGSSAAPLYRSYLKFTIVAGGVAQVTLQALTPHYVTWGTMQHVRVVENGNGYYMFLDGHLVATANTASRAANYTGLFYVGARSTPDRFFKGYIDEFCLFNGTALSTTDFAPPTTPWGISGVEVPYELATTYTEAELPALKWAQSADTLWIVHPLHKPALLTRTGHTAWTLTDITFTAAPADWGVGNWPQSCCFHEQRFCYGGTSTSPQTVWLSKSGDYHNFTMGVGDDDACEYTVPAERVDGIKWLVSTTASLLVGTSGGEYIMKGGETGITPTSIDVKEATQHRCYDLNPIKVSSAVLFLQTYGRKIRELAYRFDDDSYHAPDLCILAEHITTGGIRYMAYQQEPNSLLWAVRADGVLCSLSYMREEEIVGWARQITDGVVEDVACIPDPTGNFDELWGVIKRVIEDVDYRYIEYLDADMPVDSGITYIGAPVNTVCGLLHLEAETVDIVGDGIVRGQQVVNKGCVTFNGAAASLIYIGLPFTSRLITMKPNIGIDPGTSAGLPKKWAELFADLLESSGVEINNEVIPFRKVGDVIGAAVIPYTGEKRVSQLGWNDGRITIKQSLPLPCTIRGLYGVLEIGD